MKRFYLQDILIINPHNRIIEYNIFIRVTFFFLYDIPVMTVYYLFLVFIEMLIIEPAFDLYFKSKKKECIKRNKHRYKRQVFPITGVTDNFECIDCEESYYTYIKNLHPKEPIDLNSEFLEA